MVPKIRRTFQVCCFFMAIYWTALFTNQYGENRDAISITMKKFNHDTSDKYPTFSFCIKGTELHWSHEHEIFEAYGINAFQYESMLKGETTMRYDFDDSSKLYRNTPVFVNDGIIVNFSRFHTKLSEILSDVEFKVETRITTVDGQKKKGYMAKTDSKILLSYQSPNTICFTRNSSDPLNSIRLQDMITFNSSFLNTTEYKRAHIQIFVHYPGQLISSFDKPKYESTFSYLLSTLRETGANPRVLDFKLSQCRVLRKRHDSKIPCNKHIKNYDKFIEEQLAGQLGCTPPYWKNYISIMNGTEECTSADKLREAYSYLADFKKTLDETDHPCDEMLIQSIDSINYKPIPIPQDMSIAFHYTEKMYEEIQYTRAMGFESWLSNVGGFVGIFLGYSIMQIPDIFSYLIKSLYEKRDKFCL